MGFVLGLCAIFQCLIYIHIYSLHICSGGEVLRIEVPQSSNHPQEGCQKKKSYKYCASTVVLETRATIERCATFFSARFPQFWGLYSRDIPLPNTDLGKNKTPFYRMKKSRGLDRCTTRIRQKKMSCYFLFSRRFWVKDSPSSTTTISDEKWSRSTVALPRNFALTKSAVSKPAPPMIPVASRLKYGVPSTPRRHRWTGLCTQENTWILLFPNSILPCIE